jgi:hypothetical protein
MYIYIYVYSNFILLLSQYFTRAMVIFLLIPLFNAKSSRRMREEGQISSKVEKKSTRIEVFGGENRMEGRGTDSSGPGYGHVAGFLDMTMNVRVSQNLAKFLVWLRGSFRKGIFI